MEWTEILRAQTVVRCAIYTRKSSSEGLEQPFNSLEAQREACEAYVASQAGEGWECLPDRYDDGGFSGGTINRPGLQALLADIATKKIEAVIVYKVDRLSRSLSDFVWLMEQFGLTETSFVSITQAFNTTSSMGRLTLNVLLSFAQFEREISGERIRDKIAASKSRGMWMGGLTPLGYDVPIDKDRMLRLNPAEAATVRLIFTLYLKLRSIQAVRLEMARRGIRSKTRVRADGIVWGGCLFTNGGLRHILKNVIYLGQISHKGTVYPGLHKAIVPKGMFQRVQTLLAENLEKKCRQCRETTPLAGKLFLSDGRPMTPTSSKTRAGQVYRYYMTMPEPSGGQGAVRLRLSAHRFEARIKRILQRLGVASVSAFETVRRIELHEDAIQITLPSKLEQILKARLESDEELQSIAPSLIRWSIPWAWPRRGCEIVKPPTDHQRDPALIRALRAAHGLLDHDYRGRPTLRRVPDSRYHRKLTRLAFLSPRIQAAILDGSQPTNLTLEALFKAQIPADWKHQEARFLS